MSCPQDCTAFEIGDEGEDWNTAGEAKLTKPNSLCSLKNFATGSVSTPSDLGKDCFSNLRRQSENNIRAIMETTDMDLASQKLTYPGIGCVGNECIVEGDWLLQEDVATNPMVVRMLVRESECVEDGGLAGEVVGECDAECT